MVLHCIALHPTVMVILGLYSPVQSGAGADHISLVKDSPKIYNICGLSDLFSVVCSYFLVIFGHFFFFFFFLYIFLLFFWMFFLIVL